MNSQTGTITSLGKTEAGKLVMPMALATDKPLLYAAVRSEPLHVITYAIDPSSGEPHFDIPDRRKLRRA